MKATAVQCSSYLPSWQGKPTGIDAKFFKYRRPCIKFFGPGSYFLFFILFDAVVGNMKNWKLGLAVLPGRHGMWSLVWNSGELVYSQCSKCHCCHCTHCSVSTVSYLQCIIGADEALCLAHCLSLRTVLLFKMHLCCFWWAVEATLHHEPLLLETWNLSLGI